MEKLQEIFNLQTTLVNHYIKIYGLPPIPLIIDNKKHQEVVRHLISSIIEELSESFTVFKKIYTLYVSEPDLTTIPKEFKAFNHELSDTFHFFIELLLYANVTPESLAGYVDTMMEEIDVSGQLITGSCTLTNLFFITKQMRYNQNIKDNRINPLFKDIEEIYKGGKNMDQQSIVELPLLMWDITHNLNLAQNELKNKLWVQTETKTQVMEFQNHLLNSFMGFINLLSVLSHNAESIYLLYKEKNGINLKRIESKY